MKKIAVWIMAAWISSAALYAQTGIKRLLPSETGEFAARGYGDTKVENRDETYEYHASPNGRYYHFETFVSEGDSQWDGVRYHEKFTASSALPPANSFSYGAENLSNLISAEGTLAGGDRNTAWCEGADGYGAGERVVMSVTTQALNEGKDDELCITSLLIVNGYAKSAAAWKSNSRVKTLRLHVGGKPLCDLQLKDVIKPQVFELPEDLRIYPAQSGKQIPRKGAFPDDREDTGSEDLPYPVYQTDLTFEILEVYPGDKYDDTCITGIAVDIYSGIY